MDNAVILAAGRGTRIQRSESSAAISTEQAEVARTGVKSLIPVGRPFIDHVLARLADAGYTRACLVIGPKHDALRAHASQYSGGRLDIQFAIQPHPLGTANAVLAAADFINDEPFLLINSDNLYPRSALAGLRSFLGSAVAAFRPEGLLEGNIPPNRLRNYALLTVSDEGYLQQIIEKPAQDALNDACAAPLISMNCWRFAPSILDACRAIGLSVRGEFELTDAVMHAITHLDERFKTLINNEPVLDLSFPADIESVARQLSAVEVRL
jgi:dTDP-glucose pyrophosphorylase